MIDVIGATVAGALVGAPQLYIVFNCAISILLSPLRCPIFARGSFGVMVSKPFLLKEDLR